VLNALILSDENMSRRPILLRPARATPPGIVISALAEAITVSVTVSPTKGYTTTSFYITVSWSPSPSATYAVNVEFGDGQTTGGQVPTSPFTCSHTYANPGTYTVKATVKNMVTGGTGTGSATVQVTTALSVTFTADKTSGNVPLTVTFTVNITGGYSPYSYSIDPGDGSTPYTGTRSSAGSFTQAHTYSKSGTYTAKCTVDDALGTTVAQTVSVGAGVVILFPRLRELFPGLFERIDKWRQRLPGPFVGQEAGQEV